MPCPDIMLLEQFVLDGLTGDEARSVESHLAECKACSAQLDEMNENLLLASSLRQGAVSAPPAVFESMPESVGPYRIIRRIGQGGMGAVYDAQQENPRRTVALKMLRPGLVSRALLARFRHETQVLGRLRHPGIAQIYEAGTHYTPQGAQPYFVMELVHGTTLIKYAQMNELDTAARLKLVADICDAVQHAHQRGVIHRDLKPDNILIDDSGGHAQPKILDFGVARLVDPDGKTTTLHTSVGQIVGTVAYMSPEQVSGEPADVDTRSDVYAIGVVCYELLSSKLPFRVTPASIAESVRAISQDEPQPLSTISRSLRGDVTTIVGKALEKDKNRRYQSAAELAEDIRRYLRHEPISAHPPSTMYQLGKFARRNRGLVGGIAAAFVILILGIVGTTIGLIRAQQSAASARIEAEKSRTINQFLNDMLSSANPNKRTASELNKGRDVTVLQTLDEATAKLDAGSLKDQPAVGAAVRRTLASTYSALGEYPKAERLIREALALDRTARGPAQAELIDDLQGLAMVLHHQGRLQEAESHYRQALQAARKLYPEESERVARSINDLAAALRDLGNYAEAETLFRSALETRKRLLGPDHRDVAVTMTHLASALQQQGKLEEAELFQRQSLEIRRKHLGAEHPEVASGLYDLGSVLYLQRRPGDAEVVIREALDMRRKLFGDEHPDVAESFSGLAVMYRERGALAEAEEMLRESAKINTKLFGEHSTETAHALANLAFVLRDQQKLPQAEELLREVLVIQQEQLGNDHPRVAQQLHNLGGILLDQKKLDESAANFRRALEIRRQRLGPEQWETTTTQVNLGTCLRAMNRLDEAEPLLLEAFAIIERANGPKHARTAWAASHIVRLYEVWNKPERAAKFRAYVPATSPASQPATRAS